MVSLSAGDVELVQDVLPCLIDKVCVCDVTGCMVQVRPWLKAAQPRLALFNLLAAERHLKSGAILTTCSQELTDATCRQFRL